MIKIIKGNINSFIRYIRRSKVLLSIAILAYFIIAFLLSSMYTLPSKISTNPSQYETEAFINNLNLLFITIIVLFIIFVFTLFLSIIRHLIKDSLNNYYDNCSMLFASMTLIISLTILGFGLIYKYSSPFISNYTEVLVTIDKALEHHPDLQLNERTKDTITFIKNSNIEYYKIFKTEKESITNLDYLLYSIATFFSVNYSDIIPNNIIVQLIVLLENIASFIITIVYIPLIINYIQMNKKDNINQEINNNVYLHLEQGNTTLIYELKEVIKK